jgi:hypothetical protein
MTNREMMMDIVRRIPDISALAMDAAALLGIAQNGPPYGEADGTIDSASWYKLRDIVRALELVAALK